MNLRRWLALSIVVSGLGYGIGARADAITLNSGSDFGASADNEFPPVVVPGVASPANVPVESSVIPVTALPYSGTANASGIFGDTSTTGANLTTGAFKFTFDQNVTSEIGNTDGFGDMFFTANSSVSYSIAGFIDFEAPDDSLQSGEMFIKLVDISKQGQVVFEDDEFLPASGTANANGDGIAGNLIAGDQYEFYADENMGAFADPTVNGNASITFGSVTPPGGGSSTPLPSGLAGGLLALGLAAGTLGYRRRQIA